MTRYGTLIAWPSSSAQRLRERPSAEPRRGEGRGSEAQRSCGEQCEPQGGVNPSTGELASARTATVFPGSRLRPRSSSSSMRDGVPNATTAGMEAREPQSSPESRACAPRATGLSARLVLQGRTSASAESGHRRRWLTEGPSPGTHSDISRARSAFVIGVITDSFAVSNRRPRREIVREAPIKKGL